MPNNYLNTQQKLHRRSFLMGSIGLAIAGTLSACSDSSDDAASTATETEVETSTDATTAAAEETTTTSEATGPEYHEPADDNTELSAGSWSGSIGDQSVTLNGAYLVDGIEATIDGGTFESTTGDETVFLVVNGGSLNITNAQINKSGDGTATGNNGLSDDYNFYGLNSTVVVIGSGSSATVNETSIDVTAVGANAIFSSDTAEITVTACAITTDGDPSRGLHATYEGVISGSNLSIETQGAHCAAVATDRGNGTVTVDGTNTFSTNGDGSPLVYSTGDITVSGMTGSAGESEAVVVEGKNHAILSDCVMESNSDRSGVMLYQSMSGDAADSDAANSVSTLEMTKVELTCLQDVPTLFVTNTTSEATLTNCTLDAPGGLIEAEEDRWGTSGSNGGTVTVTLDGTSSDGAITAGSSSSITVVTANGGEATGETSGDVTVS